MDLMEHGRGLSKWILREVERSGRVWVQRTHRRWDWEQVPLPSNRKPIGCKWVFKEKKGSDSSVKRFKARLVAKGYAKKYWVDYDKTFSPVIRFSSIRFLLAYAKKKHDCPSDGCSHCISQRHTGWRDLHGEASWLYTGRKRTSDWRNLCIVSSNLQGVGTKDS